MKIYSVDDRVFKNKKDAVKASKVNYNASAPWYKIPIYSAEFDLLKPVLVDLLNDEFEGWIEEDLGGWIG